MSRFFPLFLDHTYLLRNVILKVVPSYHEYNIVPTIDVSLFMPEVRCLASQKSAETQ